MIDQNDIALRNCDNGGVLLRCLIETFRSMGFLLIGSFAILEGHRRSIVTERVRKSSGISVQFRWVRRINNAVVVERDKLSYLR